MLMLFKKIQMTVDGNQKICVDKGSKFYNRWMKSWLQDSNIDMHSTNNRRKSVFTERFIRTLKNNIYNCVNLVPKMHIFID